MTGTRGRAAGVLRWLVPGCAVGSGEAEFRIEYVVQRRLPGDEDFDDVGFGSSGAWASVDEAVRMVASDVQNRTWEAEPGMPNPDTVEG